MTDKPRKQKLPGSRTITIPDAIYQPPKAEQKKEYAMPGADMKMIRRAFFRPINVKREAKD